MPSLSLSTSSQAIRDSSNRLASLSLTNRGRRVSSSSATFSDFYEPPVSPGVSARPPRNSVNNRPILSGPLTDNSTGSDSVPQPDDSIMSSLGTLKRSNLSMMLDREKVTRSQNQKSDQNTGVKPIGIAEVDEMMPVISSGENRSEQADPSDMNANDVTAVTRPEGVSEWMESTSRAIHDFSPDRWPHLAAGVSADLGPSTERTPLMADYGSRGSRSRAWETYRSFQQRATKITPRDVVRECVEEPLKTLPSVILGVLLNVLDGVSYGMILWVYSVVQTNYHSQSRRFPASPVFKDFGSLGVSMFFVSFVTSDIHLTGRMPDAYQ